MKKSSVLAFFIAASFLSGCALTPEGLKSNPENRSSFVTDDGYQLVFKRITDAQKECAPVPLLPIGQSIADAKLFSDLKLGTLTLGASGVGTQIYQVIEVQGLDNGKTEVVLFAKVKTQAHLERLKRWASGSLSCDI